MAHIEITNLQKVKYGLYVLMAPQ